MPKRKKPDVVTATVAEVAVTIWDGKKERPGPVSRAEWKQDWEQRTQAIKRIDPTDSALARHRGSAKLDRKERKAQLNDLLGALAIAKLYGEREIVGAVGPERYAAVRFELIDVLAARLIAKRIWRRKENQVWNQVQKEASEIKNRAILEGIKKLKPKMPRGLNKGGQKSWLVGALLEDLGIETSERNLERLRRSPGW